MMTLVRESKARVSARSPAASQHLATLWASADSPTTPNANLLNQELPLNKIDLPVTHYIYTLCTTSNPQSPQPHRLLQVTVAATSSHTLTRFTEVQPDSASPQACSTLLLAFHPGDRTCLGLIHVQPGTVGIDTCGAAFDEWGMKANM